KLPVSLHQPRNVRIEHEAQRVVLCHGRDVGIESPNGIPQPARQHYLPIRIPLPPRRLSVRRRNLRPIGRGPAQLFQPSESYLLQMVLTHNTHHTTSWTSSSASRIETLPEIRRGRRVSRSSINV